MGSCFLGRGLNNGWSCCGAGLLGVGGCGGFRAIIQSCTGQGLHKKSLDILFKNFP
jgi:hypothetical protein